MAIEAGQPRHHRRGRVLFNIALSLLLVLGIVIVLNLLGRTRFHRADLTELGELSLTRPTRSVLRSLDDIVAIKAYISEGIPEVYRSYVDQVRELLQEYRANGLGNVRLEFLDPSADAEAEKDVKGLGIEPGQFQTVKKDQRSVEFLYCAIGVSYRSQYDTINLVEIQEPAYWAPALEYLLTRAIVRVSAGAPIVIGFHGEANPPPERGQRPASPLPQYYLFREELLKQLDVVDVDLRKGEPVPENVDTLLVIQPRNITERESYEIDQFVMRGGKVILMIDRFAESPRAPNRIEEIESGVLDLLESYGVAVERGLVKDTRMDSIRAMEPVRIPGGRVLQRPVQVRYPFAVLVEEDGLDRSNPITAALESVSFLWASPLRLIPSQVVGKRVYEIARSSAGSWVVEEPRTFDPEKTPPDAAPRSAEAGSRLLAVVLGGKFDSFFADKQVPLTQAEIDGEEPEEQPQEPMKAGPINRDSTYGRTTRTSSPATRIMVIGDADSLSDGMRRGQPAIWAKGISFALNAVDWFTMESELIEIRSRGFVDRSLEGVSDSARAWAKIINIGGVPVLVALFGLLRFLVRGRGRKTLRPRPIAVGEGHDT